MYILFGTKWSKLHCGPLWSGQPTEQNHTASHYDALTSSDLGSDIILLCWGCTCIVGPCYYTCPSGAYCPKGHCSQFFYPNIWNTGEVISQLWLYIYHRSGYFGQLLRWRKSNVEKLLHILLTMYIVGQLGGNLDLQYVLDSRPRLSSLSVVCIVMSHMLTM